MPYSRTEIYSTPGTKVSWNLDPSISPFNATVGFGLSDGGTVSYQLQYSLSPLDDPQLTDDDAIWFDSPDIPSGSTAALVAAFVTPVARVRVIIASLAGSLTMQMLQGYSTN